MRFIKAHVFRSDLMPPGKALVVYEDDDGWFYLKALVKLEGPATPFSSIAEIEAYVDRKLKLDFSVELDVDGRVKRKT